MASNVDRHGWTAVSRSLKTLVGQTSAGDTKAVTFKEVAPPMSTLANSVLSYARQKLPLPTLNHSLRVYSYGEAIRQQHFPSWKIDNETLFLAALLHDIGTTPANISASRLSFEFHGGMISLDVLKEFEAETSQREAVCETIIRHQDLGDTGNVTELTAIIQFATVLDNAGMFPELVHIDTIRSIVSEYPRLGWTGCFAEVIRKECGLKPWANTTRIDGFAEMVEDNKLMAEFD